MNGKNSRSRSLMHWRLGPRVAIITSCTHACPILRDLGAKWSFHFFFFFFFFSADADFTHFSLENLSFLAYSSDFNISTFLDIWIQKLETYAKNMTKQRSVGKKYSEYSKVYLILQQRTSLV